jgi:D-alanyl-D-alanine dipeptidase
MMFKRGKLEIVLLLLLAAASTVAQTTRSSKPLPPPARWLGLIGEYGPDANILIVLEKDGTLQATFNRGESEPLREISANVFAFQSGPHTGRQLVFARNPHGHATEVRLGDSILKRRPIGPEEGAPQLRVKPVRPVKDLLREAFLAQPPKESGEFRSPDLVELNKLDPSIKLDIRYATTNNFLGTIFYTQARAFMQRPAAEAVVRVNRKLRALGYGLLVHDAYRPWFVTKVFWDATPVDKHVFVADPAKGSRHNRGCAVDLTLYDLKSGRPIEMVSTYDETTDRAYPNYPGGTSLQRWHRELLRRVMESEGFTVYEAEWWHFDYKDWQQYPITNIPFEKIGARPKPSADRAQLRLANRKTGVKEFCGEWSRSAGDNRPDPSKDSSKAHFKPILYDRAIVPETDLSAASKAAQLTSEIQPFYYLF